MVIMPFEVDVNNIINELSHELQDIKIVSKAFLELISVQGRAYLGNGYVEEFSAKSDAIIVRFSYDSTKFETQPTAKGFIEYLKSSLLSAQEMFSNGVDENGLHVAEHKYRSKLCLMNKYKKAGYKNLEPIIKEAKKLERHPHIWANIRDIDLGMSSKGEQFIYYLSIYPVSRCDANRVVLSIEDITLANRVFRIVPDGILQGMSFTIEGSVESNVITGKGKKGVLLSIKPNK